MYKPVDNHCKNVRITTVDLWISCGRKKFKMNGRRPLRDRGERSRNTSPLETGTVRVKPGTWEAPGNRHFTRVPGTGGRRVTPEWAAHRRARRACQARPPPSHTWRGPCPFCSGRVVIPGTSPAANITAMPNTSQAAESAPS